MGIGVVQGVRQSPRSKIEVSQCRPADMPTQEVSDFVRHHHYGPGNQQQYGEAEIAYQRELQRPDNNPFTG